ncbi:hypothetical protein O1L44_20125 [Streptomyces noursei]|nr:hypothetical protein SNOUR_24530 [Streptomyces noursei ATCC 11455]MCZ0994969.1 hypothetical protein [Streptomyces noursei]
MSGRSPTEGDHLATAGLAARAVKAYVERAAAYDRRWSDHAPVTVVYEA